MVGRVSGLEAGVYRYLPKAHRVTLVARGDRRKALAHAAVDQDWIVRAPVCIALAAVERRTARRYQDRAALYVSFEAGCASENAALQAAALGLGTCVVGAFEDDAVAKLLGLGRGERPLALMPVGRT
jgi:SagB-type dehydrogenase family enzyme